MRRIFISYSRTDEAFARQLAASLEQLGADIWLDVDDIPAGVNWANAIQEGLDLCEVMLVIISPESMSSKNVADEWQSYLDDKKPVIPILLRPARLHFQLRRLQHVDFCQQEFPRALRRLHAELKRQGVGLGPFPEEKVTPVVPVAAGVEPVHKPLRQSRQVWTIIFVAILGIIAAGVFLLPGLLENDENKAAADLRATIAAAPTLTPYPTYTPPPTLTPSPSPNYTQTSAAIDAQQTQAAARLQATFDARETQAAENALAMIAAAPTATPYPTYTPLPTLTPSLTPDYTQTSAAIDAQQTQAAVNFWATFDARETQAAEDRAATLTAAPTVTPYPTSTATLTPSLTPNYAQTSAVIDAQQTQAALDLRATLDAQQTQTALDLRATLDAQQTQAALDLQATLDAQQTQAALDLRATFDAQRTQAAADLRATIAAAPTATPYPTYTPPPTLTPLPTGAAEVAVVPPQPTPEPVFELSPEMAQLSPITTSNLTQLVMLDTFTPSLNSYTKVFSPDASHIAFIGCLKNDTITYQCLREGINLWDLTTMTDLGIIGLLENGSYFYFQGPNVPSVFSPDGKTLYVAHEGKVEGWDITTGWGSTLFEFVPGTPVVFSPNGKLFAYSDEDNTTLHILETSTFTETQVIDTDLTLDANHTNFFFSQDGSILVAYSGGDVRMWNIATGQARTTVLGGLGLDEDFGLSTLSPDGKILLVGTEGIIRRWDSITGNELDPLQIRYETGEVYTGQVWGPTCSPDGTMLTVTLEDFKGRILDATTGQTLLVLDRSVDFNPDGRLMLVDIVQATQGYTVYGVATCTVFASGGAANIRDGIGSSAAIVDQLQPGDVTAAIGQTTGADGKIWWKLWGLRWVSSEVVTTSGDCANLPVITP